MTKKIMYVKREMLKCYINMKMSYCKVGEERSLYDIYGQSWTIQK